MIYHNKELRIFCFCSYLIKKKKKEETTRTNDFFFQKYNIGYKFGTKSFQNKHFSQT